MKLMEGEEVIHKLRPARSLLVIWFFTKCLPWGIATAALAAVVALIVGEASRGPLPDNENPSATLIVGAAVAALFLFTALPFVYFIFLRRTYIYTITGQRCVFHGGILRRIERSVPYHKITDVERKQNIVERILGISTLNIFTPGTASMPVHSGFLLTSAGGQRAELSFVGLRDSDAPATSINEILRQYKATGE